MQPRARDDKKPASTDQTKSKCSPPPTSQASSAMDTSSKSSNPPAEDPYEFKASKADQPLSTTSQTGGTSAAEHSAGSGEATEGGADVAETQQSGQADAKGGPDDGNTPKRSYEEGEGETDEESKRKKRKEESKEKGGGTPVRSTGQTGKYLISGLANSNID